jgi:hypothetical protein
MSIAIKIFYQFWQKIERVLQANLDVKEVFMLRIWKIKHLTKNVPFM